ncbi:hypothetical protein HBDW_08280 [Herbaspirillum sp. DW155]|uniref:hypothetical protein n=1 Tax=Herbaspirillum sp. DW155 TaxID=3095609 RepID=UPI003091D9B3|nr:hypothetical protein HBDW_08280 [Herbaspirillum sp. DW155]
MNRILTALPVFFGALLLCCAARAATGLGIELGDDVSSVRQALQTEMPEETEMSPAMGSSVIHLRTRGIWVFLTAGKVATIRLDAPYAAAVNGIRIGDGYGKLMSTMGQPKFAFPFGNLQAFTYPLDGSSYIRFDLDEDGVQIIYILPARKK